MLIETDQVDWDKPIVYYDGKVVYKAKLVSKRYGTYKKYLIIIHMPNQDSQVEINFKDGVVSGTRYIYNYHPEHESKLFDPDAPVTSEEAGTF